MLEGTVNVHFLTADFDVTSDPTTTDDQFEAFCDRLMEELLTLEGVGVGVVDPDLGASIARRVITVSMGVEADTLNDAVRLYLANTRTAFHATECGTPDWPNFQPATPRPEVRELASAGA